MNCYEDINQIIKLNKDYELVKNKILSNVFTSYKLNCIQIHSNKQNFCLLPLREKECSICYNETSLRTSKIFQCNHFICIDCFKKWNFNCITNNKYVSCPYCRNIDIY